MDVSPRIAIDAMGGDIGPAVMIAGMARARRKDRSRVRVYRRRKEDRAEELASISR